MRLIGVVAGLSIMVAAVLFFGIGGINQLVDGLEVEPNDWSDVVWGSVRIVFTTTVFGLGAAVTAVSVWADEDF